MLFINRFNISKKDKIHIMKALTVVTALLGGNIYEDWVPYVMNLHNKVRRDCGMADLTWDPVLAAQANKNAQACVFEHSPQILWSNYGENIASGAKLQPDQLAQLWADEKSKYVQGSDYNSWASNYTQIAWKDTTKVGCGFAQKCPRVGNYLVCQYQAKGNVPGTFAKQVCIGSSGTTTTTTPTTITIPSTSTSSQTSTTQKINPDGSITKTTTTINSDGSRSKTVTTSKTSTVTSVKDLSSLPSSSKPKPNFFDPNFDWNSYFGF